ncbi:MAG: DUF357 domain-containing protein [Candidatus Micrarchaeia archaeon]
MEIEERISKDIKKFEISTIRYNRVNFDKLSKEDFDRIMEIAKMYASDASSWLEKRDYYTAFASISYAHGLLDALLKLGHVIE